MRKIFILAISISISGICFSQSLSRNDLIELANRLESFVSKKDDLYDAKRSSEFIYVLINVDSEGAINKLDFSGIKSDTIYQILSSLKPADLGDWKYLKCKGKTIVIPLFYIANNKNIDKIKQMFNAHYSKIPQKDMITEVGNTILIRYMSIMGPQKPQEGLKTSKYKVVDR